MNHYGHYFERLLPYGAESTVTLNIRTHYIQYPFKRPPPIYGQNSCALIVSTANEENLIRTFDVQTS